MPHCSPHRPAKFSNKGSSKVLLPLPVMMSKKCLIVDFIYAVFPERPHFHIKIIVNEF